MYKNRSRRIGEGTREGEINILYSKYCTAKRGRHQKEFVKLRTFHQSRISFSSK